MDLARERPSGRLGHTPAWRHPARFGVREFPAAGGECGVADLAGRVIQVLERFCDALAGRAAGQIRGGLPAKPDVVQAGDDRVEEFLAVVCLPGRSWGPGEIGEVGELAGLGDVADDGEGEGAGRGRHGAEGALMSSAPDVIVSGRRPRQAHRRGTLAAWPPGHQAFPGDRSVRRSGIGVPARCGAARADRRSWMQPAKLHGGRRAIRGQRPVQAKPLAQVHGEQLQRPDHIMEQPVSQHSRRISRTALTRRAAYRSSCGSSYSCQAPARNTAYGSAEPSRHANSFQGRRRPPGMTAAYPTGAFVRHRPFRGKKKRILSAERTVVFVIRHAARTRRRRRARRVDVSGPHPMRSAGCARR